MLKPKMTQITSPVLAALEAEQRNQILIRDEFFTSRNNRSRNPKVDAAKA